MKDRSIPAQYSHNLVSTLYAMKGLLETCGLPRAALKRACGQADEALKIAKRLGSVWVVRGDGNEKALPSRLRVSVKRAWQKTLGLLKKEFSLSAVEILERVPDPFPFVECHPRDLAEILYHLARNAVQAMKGEGKLILRTQLAFTTREEAFATIQLADTGPGIPEGELPNLFLPFFSTKSARQGNGLGLYLVHQLVRRNGGRITVSSFKNAGTTFTLDFPLAKRK